MNKDFVEDLKKFGITLDFDEVTDNGILELSLYIAEKLWEISQSLKYQQGAGNG